MPPLAQRNLFHDKVRLAVTLTGSRTTAERSGYEDSGDSGGA